MGHPAAMCQLVGRARKDPKIQKILKKYEKIFKSKDTVPAFNQGNQPMLFHSGCRSIAFLEAAKAAWGVTGVACSTYTNYGSRIEWDFIPCDNRTIKIKLASPSKTYPGNFEAR